MSRIGFLKRDISSNRAVWFLLFCAVIGVLTFSVVQSDQSEPEEARVQRLRESFACPSCKGQSVAESNAPIANNISLSIESEVLAGSTDTQIRDILVQNWGKKVLLNPPSEGFSALVWAIPVFLFVVGGFLFLWFAKLRDTSESQRAASSTQRRLGYLCFVLFIAVSSGFAVSRFLGERGVSDSLTGTITSPGQQLEECKVLADGGRYSEATLCVDVLLLDDPNNSYIQEFREEYVLEGQVADCRSLTIGEDNMDTIACLAQLLDPEE